MKKDKPVKKTSIKDMILEKQVKSPSFKTKLESTNKYDLELYGEKARIYNENIESFDEDYSSVVPTDMQLLIRLYAKEPKLVNGLYEYNAPKVPVQTQAGTHIKEYVDSPYPFTKKAIIVAVSDRLKNEFKAGEIIQIADIPVHCPFPGKRDVVPAFAYTHYEYDNVQPPSDVDHKHFGYFLVPMSIVSTKL